MTSLPASICDLLAAIDATEHGYMIRKTEIDDDPEWNERVLQTSLDCDLIESIQSDDRRWRILRILPYGQELLADAAPPQGDA